MKTEILEIDKNNIDRDKILRAAQILKSGGLVAFPTETVYGLGANALDEKAVRKIFEAKGRPSDNPLIVHIADVSWVSRLAREVPCIAESLMESFWPGPLTLVMAKSGAVPAAVTAGLDTVAVRMPSHPVALALISQAEIPVAAPSANVSGKPSPTAAGHVIDDLFGKVDIIIDSGRTDVGLESTVLDLTADPPEILRPGGVTAHQLKKVAGSVIGEFAMQNNGEEGGFADSTPKSPGLKYAHYSPEAKVIVIEGELQSVAGMIVKLAREYASKGMKIGVLATKETEGFYAGMEVVCAGSRAEPETIAANLFAALREFDRRGVKLVLAEAVDSSGIGCAIMNRLVKAAGYDIIKA